MKKVALIGCGALGRVFALHFREKLGKWYTLSGVYARTEEKRQALAEEAGCRACESLADLLADCPDYVVELAGGAAVKEYGEQVLKAGCNLVVVSIGALADETLRTRLAETAEMNGVRIYLPNGAIGGLDVMQTMALMGPMHASIDNVKAPGSLNGAPWLEGEALPEDREKQVFRGGVQAAIRGFPKNVNVAVAASLASEQTDFEVGIRSVPGLTENCHTVRLENATGIVTMSFASRPDPENPKSSTITAWSVIALLRNLVSTIVYF